MDRYRCGHSIIRLFALQVNSLSSVIISNINFALFNPRVLECFKRRISIDSKELFYEIFCIWGSINPLFIGLIEILSEDFLVLLCLRRTLKWMFPFADQLVSNHPDIPHIDKLCISNTLEYLRSFVAWCASWGIHFMFIILSYVLDSLRFHKRFADPKINYFNLREIFRNQDIFWFKISMADTSLLHITNWFK